jgi:hypothetical protein
MYNTMFAAARFAFPSPFTVRRRHSAGRWPSKAVRTVAPPIDTAAAKNATLKAPTQSTAALAMRVESALGPRGPTNSELLNTIHTIFVIVRSY